MRLKEALQFVNGEIDLESRGWNRVLAEVNGDVDFVYSHPELWPGSMNGMFAADAIIRQLQDDIRTIAEEQANATQHN